MWVEHPKEALRMRVTYLVLDLNITSSSKMSPFSITRVKNSKIALLICVDIGWKKAKSRA